jgi:hypothetical protein
MLELLREIFVDKVILNGTKIAVGAKVVDVYTDKLFKLGWAMSSKLTPNPSAKESPINT